MPTTILVQASGIITRGLACMCQQSLSLVFQATWKKFNILDGYHSFWKSNRLLRVQNPKFMQFIHIFFEASYRQTNQQTMRTDVKWIIILSSSYSIYSMSALFVGLSVSRMPQKIVNKRKKRVQLQWSVAVCVRVLTWVIRGGVGRQSTSQLTQLQCPIIQSTLQVSDLPLRASTQANLIHKTMATHQSLGHAGYAGNKGCGSGLMYKYWYNHKALGVLDPIRGWKKFCHTLVTYYLD